MVEITKFITDQSITVVMCGLFIWQYMRQQKYNESREDKLYSVIAAMSQILPEIKKDVKTILNKVQKG